MTEYETLNDYLGESKKKVDRRYLAHMFPRLSKKEDYERLKIDPESASYISTRDVAQQITKIITYHLHKMEIDSHDVSIVDATAGVGGNTLSFSQHFKKVIGIELDPLRYEYLENNIKVYGYENIETICNDCLNHVNNLSAAVMFFDPPWGGKGYKLKESVNLFLSDVDIGEIISGLIKKASIELLVLKVPKNFNLEKFYFKINSKQMYLYHLKKMDVIVIENSMNTMTF